MRLSASASPTELNQKNLSPKAIEVAQVGLDGPSQPQRVAHCTAD